MGTCFRVVPTTTWAPALVGIEGFSSLDASPVLKSAADFLAGAGVVCGTLALLVVAIACCGSQSLMGGKELVVCP